MLDDFFTRAVIGGIGVAIVAGPVGCFIIWRRLAYFGDTLSHSALLGVALALLLEMNITVSVFVISLVVSLLLLLLQRRATLSSDALLGLLAHATLAVGLVVLAFMTWVRVDLMGFLFGDILSVTPTDLAIIWGGGAAVLAVLAMIWLYIDTQNAYEVVMLSKAVFWLVIPSLILFITFPVFIKWHWNFYFAMLTAIMLTIVGYFIMVSILQRFGIKL